jgi:p-cumate 2,3-dioxygenase beta subunit
MTTTHHPLAPELVRDIERFLYDEAALLDEWRLREWLELLTEDCRYLVPAPDAREAENTSNTLFIIADDYHHIVGRVTRLESDAAYAERPRSRTRHLITNVRVDPVDDNMFRVESNFVVHRSRRGVVDVFFGRYRHLLVRGDDGRLKVKERRAILDGETLRPQGKVSFIL